MSAEERVPLVTAQPVTAQPVEFVRAYPVLAGIEGEVQHPYSSCLCDTFHIIYCCFTDRCPKDIPKEWSELISPQLWGIIQSSQQWVIRQHIKVGPKTGCCDCPVPCAPQENTYSIYAGLDTDSYFEILTADEVSDDCNRCCCRPHHPFRLEVREKRHIGPGIVFDYDHIKNDLREDYRRTRGFINPRARNFQRSVEPALFSIVRNDGTRCCCDCGNTKCLNCCVCGPICMDGVRVYAGTLEDPPLTDEGKPSGEDGRPYNLPPERFIGSVSQPLFGGCCVPQVMMRERDPLTSDEKEVPFGTIVG